MTRRRRSGPQPRGGEVSPEPAASGQTTFVYVGGGARKGLRFPHTCGRELDAFGRHRWRPWSQLGQSRVHPG